MNRGDARTEIRDILGEDTADFWKDAEINRYLRKALQAFAREERWPFYMTEFTGTLLAGDSDMELTEGIADSRHLNFTLNKTTETRSYQPKRISGSEGFALRSTYATSATLSYPGWYYITQVISGTDDSSPIYVARFIPTPVSEMDVEGQYYRQPVEMTADADVLDLPVEYHDAPVHYAAMLAWLKELNGGGKAGEQSQLYANIVEKARADYRSEPDDTPLIMGGEEPTTAMHGPERDYYLSRIPETLGP